MKVKVTLVRSTIGRKPDQRKTVTALGLNKMNSTTVHEANPCVMGMINKISHLLRVEEIK